MIKAAKKLSSQSASFIAPVLFLFTLSTACGTSNPSSSDVKVTNGVAISENVFPSAVLLMLETPEGQGLCTGTFVNDSQVVTAGHCVEGLSAKNPSVFYSTKINGELTPLAQAVSFKRNPRYSIELGVNPNDVAVINFPAGTAPATTPIASQTPRVGTEFTIVGYGNNANYNNASGLLEGSGAGVKRQGRNTLEAIDNNMLSFVGLTGKETKSTYAKGELVASGEGDSGGPMFVAGKLVGVTSGGGLVKADDGVTDIAISFYVDLNNAVNKAFLATVINE
ncbi:MAG: trypsin-like serine protease [Proteobacteria bacterium]|nr:MAG: trypsin-like serine protease [Pseudomonadota bacterium]